MQLPLSITELSRLTHKSRPSLYKYLSAFEEGRYDDLPHSFLTLFRMLGDPCYEKAKVLSFCEGAFASSSHSEGYRKTVDYLSAHEGEIDFDALLLALKENTYA